jgi:hypothetical protein
VRKLLPPSAAELRCGFRAARTATGQGLEQQVAAHKLRMPHNALQKRTRAFTSRCSPAMPGRLRMCAALRPAAAPFGSMLLARHSLMIAL